MKVMMTIRANVPPTLDELQKQLGLADADVDQQFGVVEIDPDDHLFSFMVEEHKAAQVSEQSGWEVKGPYSNPRIAPFGPVQ